MSDLLLEVENLYDEYLMNSEKRGISYGEIAYFEQMSEKELNFVREELEFIQDNIEFIHAEECEYYHPHCQEGVRYIVGRENNVISGRYHDLDVAIKRAVKISKRLNEKIIIKVLKKK